MRPVLHHRRVLALVTTLAVTLGVAPGRAQGPDDISPEALAQIEALIREKESRGEVDGKIDSQLLYGLRMARGEAAAPGVMAVEVDIPYADDGHAVVDVKAHVTDGLLARLSALGAEVLASSPAESSLRIHISLDQVEALAASPDVVFIQPRQAAFTGRERVATDVKPHAARRAAAAAMLSSALDEARPDVSAVVPATGQGSRTSEGDAAHLAFAARGAFHASGAGVKIGVLSDGVTNLAASQATGDLGPVTVLPGQAGSGNEGTAMLEIIHDLAPDAQLYFATAFTSITSFADNIRALRAAGCDIIVDDVFYFVETPFQDGQAPGVISNRNGGVVIQAVNDVTASGAMYFSSAGNSGNLDDGTSGVWEGDFVDGGATGAPLGVGRVHRFGNQNFNTLTVASTGPISLYWSDPLGGSSNDYDLFRLNTAGNVVVASSTNIQNGTQDPYEQISQSTISPRIVIVKKASAAPRFLHLNTNRGQLSIATAGQTHGHAAAADAFGVAATPAVGPWPNPFTSADVVETFSSDGPRRVFFKADGTPYTPGNLSSTGGILRQKPDITAADGVSVTGVGGFPSPFFGTSAAAPHAAAIAGLLKSANPSLTPAEIRAALVSSAIDIGAPGVDRDSGAGIVMARAAMIAAGVPGTAYLHVSSVQALDNPGNGNGYPEAGEGSRLLVNVVNVGVVKATNIAASVTSPTPGISVTLPNTSAYPDLGPLEAAANAAPLLFTTASDFPCTQSAEFSLGLSAQGAGDRTLGFQVPIGVSTFSVTRNLDGVAPASAPGVSTRTGVQTLRLFRDTISSTCGSAKLPPAPTTPGIRQFDSYTFNTCSYSLPACVTVNLQGPNAINLFAAAYSPTFNPADLSQNYKADPGASAASRTFSFDLAGGAQSFAVDVHDVPPNLVQPSGDQYTLTVSGACMGTCDPLNHVPLAKAKDAAVFADSSCTASASIDDGSSDADGDPLTIAQSPAGPYPLGTTGVLLTVTDPKGATSQATAAVTVTDNTPPVIFCPQEVVINAPPAACSAVVPFALPTATDACSVEVATDHAPGEVFPVGTTTVTGTATDGSHNTATCRFNVTVLDKTPPAISCPAPVVTTTAPGLCSAAVTFAPTASDVCSPPVAISARPAAGSVFPLGTTTVVATATDAALNSASCPFTVTVVDNEPPSVTGFAVSPAVVWPANHKMVDVAVNYGLSDNCGAASCSLVVSSNEPDRVIGHKQHGGQDGEFDGDDDDAFPDWQVVDAHHVRLRAERLDKGNGRVYTLALTCTDTAGGQTVRTGTVTVPRKKPAGDRDDEDRRGDDRRDRDR